MSEKPRYRLALAFVVVIAGGGRALAQDTPWYAGVSPEQQAEALRLFDAGNAVFEQGHYAQALAIYRQAVASWDHPRIRFNMAVAFIHLDQPLAAYDEIERSLRFGAAPFEAGFHEEALTYRKLLLGQLAQLRIICREPDAQVVLDGETLFVAPGEVARVLTPGPHQLVAGKPGYVAATRALSLIAGRIEVEELELQRPPPRRTEQRWPTWVPWTVAAAGAALLVAAIPIQLDAGNRFDSYDSAVISTYKMGVREDLVAAAFRDMKGTAQTENAVAVSLFVGGGLVGAAGIAMILLNLPHEVSVAVSARGGALVLGARF